MSARSFSAEEGRALRAGSPQGLSPQSFILRSKKKRKEKGYKTPTLITATFSHLARIILGIICLIKIAVSSPLPRILGSPPPFNNNLKNKNDLRAGPSAAAFSCLGSLGLRLSFPQDGGAVGGLAAGAREGVRPCCPPVGLRLRGEGRAPWLLPRRGEEGGRRRGPRSRDRLVGRPGVPDLPTTARPGSLPAGGGGGGGYNGLPPSRRVQRAGRGRRRAGGCGEPDSGAGAERGGGWCFYITAGPATREGAERRGGGGEERAAA